MKFLYLLFTLMLLACFPEAFGQKVFVTTLGSGTKDGSSWANALDGNSTSANGFTKLANSLKSSASGQQFWISEGTYKACTDNDREKYFSINENIGIYGGFAGTETSPDQRDLKSHKSVFSGNIGLENLDTDNSFHVFVTVGGAWTNYSTLDGVRVEKGYAANSTYSIFDWRNDGGGIYNGHQLILSNNEFSNCLASQEGGAVYNGGIIQANSCLFNYNSASSGGGFCTNYSSNPLIIQSKLNYCTFSNNTGSYNGGGICNGGVSEIINCLIVNNSAMNGGGIYCGGNSNMSNISTRIFATTITKNNSDAFFNWGSAKIYNSIIWGTAIVTWNNAALDIRNSCLNSSVSGIKSMNFDPLFVSPSVSSGTASDGLLADWRLRFCSPILNMGDNSLIPSGLTKDLDQNPRIVDSVVDPGAYELDSKGLIAKVVGFGNRRIYVSESNIYVGDGSSWASSLSGNVESCKYAGQTLLYEAMKDAVIGTEIWIKKGIYKSSLTGNRNHSFTIGEGVNVYGGFSGTEVAYNQRDTKLNRTILSGNTGDLAIDTDNSYHVLNINPSNYAYADSASIDGVTIERGYSNTSDGAGILINAKTKIGLNNVDIINNVSQTWGGGIKINAQTVVKISHSRIKHNTAAEGAGIYNADSLTINYCEVDSNLSTSKAGGIANAKFCKITGGSVNKNQASTVSGGIWNKTGATLYLTGGDISGNVCKSIGGGVFNDGTAEVNGCTISYNSTNSDGGGLYNSANSKCSVTRSTIAYNSAISTIQSTGGGGICNNGSLTIERSLICNNQSSGYGAGLYNPTKVISCVVVNNVRVSIFSSGTGIWIKKGCIGVFNSTIMNNSGEGISSSTIDGYGRVVIQPDTFLVKNSIVYGNEVQYSGHFTIDNSCVEGIYPDHNNIFSDPGCVSPTTAKGAASNGLMANWSLTACSPCINKGDNSYLSANDTFDAAGNPRLKFNVVDMGAYELQTNSVEEVDYSTGLVRISDAAVLSGNGSLWSSALSGNAPSCRYPGYSMLYQALRDAPVNCQVWVKKGTYPAALDSDRNKSFLIESKTRLYGGFSGNETTLKQRVAGSNETILTGNIGNKNDSLDNSYHVVYTLPSTSAWKDTALIDNITIRDGLANGDGEKICGGGMFINSNGVVKMRSCRIISNSGTGSGNPNNSRYNGGGGLINKGFLFLEYCEVANNKAVLMGGGLFNENILSLKNCKINDNNISFAGGTWFGAWGGGGIYNLKGARITIDSCEIRRNATQNNLHGGGLYNLGKMYMSHTLMDTNFSARDGGGIYSTGAIQIADSHLTRNQTAYEGGGIYANDSLRIDRCLLDFNAGHSSPGISTGGYSFISNSEISHSISTGQAGKAGGINSRGKTRVTGCDIHSNNLKGIQMGEPGGMFNMVYIFTGSDGGGILQQGDSLWVDNCSIHHNIAGSGGGIAVYAGFAHINNTKITNNFCAGGAAIYNKAKIQVDNCLFANNTYYNGGLVKNVGNSLAILTNATISNNSMLSDMDGNGVFMHGEYQNTTSNQFKLTNCIVRSTTKMFGNYTSTVSGSESVNYSNITGGYAGIGNINKDPLFVQPTAGNDTTFNALLADWRLSACSPCINAGNDTIVTDAFDLDGSNRKFNRVDMGAYELHYDNTIVNMKDINTTKTTTKLQWKSSVKPCLTVVFLKDTVAGSPNPVPGINYMANPIYRSGTNLGGWYCIYAGNDTVVSVTGLTEATTYRMAVFNYILDSRFDSPGLFNFKTATTPVLTISPHQLSVCQGSSVDFSISIVPQPVNSNTYTVISSNDNTAVVNGSKISGVSPGKVNIIVKSLDGGLPDTCKVEVVGIVGTGSINGSTTVNQGQNSVTYSIPAIPYATSYSWTLPAGTTGTSTTNSITVNYSNAIGLGTITVKGHNLCGDGPSSELSVVITGIEDEADSRSIKVYPNPVTHELIIESAVNAEKNDFVIVNAAGQVVFTGQQLEKVLVPTINFKPGIYFIKLKSGKTIEFRKILKL